MGHPEGEIKIYDDRIHEECGISAVMLFRDAPGVTDTDAGEILYELSYQLRNRGHHSTGISIITEGGEMRTMIGEGNTHQALDPDEFKRSMRGRIGNSQGRYPTGGERDVIDIADRRNSQPITLGLFDNTEISITHNGNLSNIDSLARLYRVQDFEELSDSSIFTRIVAKEFEKAHANGSLDPLADALLEIAPQLEGAFNFTVIDDQSDRFLVVRDKESTRPLSYGEVTKNGRQVGWAVASETNAFESVTKSDNIGLEIFYGNPEAQAAPGSISIFSRDGIEVIPFVPEDQIQPKICLFEFVYIMNLNADFRSNSIESMRKRMGLNLARQLRQENQELSAYFSRQDVAIVPIPSTANPIAEGFWEAHRSAKFVEDGIKLKEIKGGAQRSFQAPTQAEREQIALDKSYVEKDSFKDEIVVLIDDSLVRGTTIKAKAKQLKEVGGAREVHILVGSRPFTQKCEKGVDVATLEELAYNVYAGDFDAMADDYGVENIFFLNKERMVASVGIPEEQLCMDCMRTPTEMAEQNEPKNVAVSL